jgi:hypothetical protein
VSLLVHPLVRFIAVLVLVLTLGLHWAMLQVVAWTGMIIVYSQDAPVRTALQKTFDGKHLCPLCKAIKQGRSEEKQKQEKQQVKPGSKMDLGLVWQCAPFDFSCDREPISSPDTDAPIRSYEPPKPRPRTA